MWKTHIALACVAACVLAVAGCYESLTSIVTPDKLVLDRTLVGDYSAADGGGRLVLEKGKDKAYAYRQYDEKGVLVNSGTLWVVKLGDATFYQYSVNDYATSDGRPLYVLGRLSIEGPPGARTLTGYAFKSEQALFDDPAVTTAEYEHVRDGERHKGRALSMPPEKLQAYLARRAAEMSEPTLKFRQVAIGGA